MLDVGRLPDPYALPESCSAIVVGAGLAGGEIAKALEDRGLSDVLILEAGPAHDLRHINSAYSADRALRMWLEPETDTYFRRPWKSQTPPHYMGNSGIRRRLGGRSLYWYGVVLPIEAWALTEPWWPAGIVSDLCNSWDGGPSLYDRIERKLGEWRSADGEALVDESPSLSLGGHQLRATPRAIRRSSLTPSRWYAYSPLDHWRHPDTGEVWRRPSGIRFFANLEVLKVIVSDGAARGVLVVRADTGECVEIRSKIVVLAAGTLENSRLAVQALFEAQATEFPRLARLVDHIVQGVFVRLERSQADRLLTVLRPGSYFAPFEWARSNLFLDVRVMPNGDLLVNLQLTGEQLPSEDSYVECDPSEHFPWDVNIHTATLPKDLAIVAAQQDILRDGWSQLARLSGCPPGILDFADYNHSQRSNAVVLADSARATSVGVPATWASFLGTEDHEGCTIPLGNVLNEDHEFVKIRGLFAGGPSTFPRLGAANPALTTLALAHRLVARLPSNV